MPPPPPSPAQTAASLLGRLHACRSQICLNPSCEIPEDIKKLRQANFKNEYKQRQSSIKGGGSPMAARGGGSGRRAGRGGSEEEEDYL